MNQPAARGRKARIWRDPRTRLWNVTINGQIVALRNNWRNAWTALMVKLYTADLEHRCELCT